MNEIEPLVSILVPTSNNEQHLEEALDSILNQTYKNWELVVWNEGSTDRTLEILLAYRQKDSRIRIFSAGRVGFDPLQLGSVLNLLAHNSRGQYICMFGGAWAYLPDKLEKQVKCFAENPGLGLVHSNMFHVDGNGNLLGRFTFPHPQYESGQILFRYLFTNFVSMPTIMVPRSVWFELGGIDPGSIADYDLWTRIMAHYRVEYIHECLVQYRIFSKSQSQEEHIALLYQYVLPEHINHYYQKFSFEQLMIPIKPDEEIVKRIDLIDMLTCMSQFDAALLESQNLLNDFPSLNQENRHKIYIQMIEYCISVKKTAQGRQLLDKIKLFESDNSLSIHRYTHKLDAIEEIYTPNEISFLEAEKLLKESSVFLYDEMELPSDLYEKLEQISTVNLKNDSIFNQLFIWNYQHLKWSETQDILWHFLKRSSSPLLIYNFGLMFLKQGKNRIAQSMFQYLIERDQRFEVLARIASIASQLNKQGMELVSAFQQSLNQCKNDLNLILICAKSDSIATSTFLLNLIDACIKNGFKVRLVAMTNKHLEIGTIAIEPWDEFVNKRPSFSDCIIACDLIAQLMMLEELPYPIRMVLRDSNIWMLTDREMKALCSHAFLDNYLNKLYVQPALLLTTSLTIKNEMSEDYCRRVEYLPPYIQSIEHNSLIGSDIYLIVSDNHHPVQVNKLQSLIQEIKKHLPELNCYVFTTSTDLMDQLNVENIQLFDNEKTLFKKVSGCFSLIYCIFGPGTPSLALKVSMEGSQVYFVTDSEITHLPSYSLSTQQNELVKTLVDSYQTAPNSKPDHVQQWLIDLNKRYPKSSHDYIEELWSHQIMSFFPSLSLNSLDIDKAIPLLQNHSVQDLSSTKISIITELKFDSEDCKELILNFLRAFKPEDDITLICISIIPISMELNEELEASILAYFNEGEMANLRFFEALNLMTLHTIVKKVSGVVLISESPDMYFAAKLWNKPIIEPNQDCLIDYYHQSIKS